VSMRTAVARSVTGSCAVWLDAHATQKTAIAGSHE
jgi:hypothetical protein